MYINTIYSTYINKCSKQKKKLYLQNKYTNIIKHEGVHRKSKGKDAKYGWKKIKY